MREALQLELPFEEVPSTGDLLSDSLHLMKDEVKTQASIFRGQLILTTIGVTIIAVKSAMKVGNTIATPFRVFAMVGLFVLMALSSAIRTAIRGIANIIRDPIEAILKFVLTTAVSTAVIFYATLGLYAVALLPLVYAIPTIAFLAMMGLCMLAMYRGFTAQFA